MPEYMRTPEVYKYYNILAKKKLSLVFKKIFDIVVSFILLLILMPIFLILAIAIKVNSRGPVFYRQVRITQYGKEFRIHKFRTMVTNAYNGSQVTVKNDNRITGVGKFIRKYRLDEISQLIDILQGNMTFVGTRPEVPKYVNQYSSEMISTLLLPAGVTSEASIYYKDEAQLLDETKDIDKAYVEDVLPGKMCYNLKAIRNLSFLYDLKVIFMTVFAFLGKDYKDNYTKHKKDQERLEEVNK